MSSFQVTREIGKRHLTSQLCQELGSMAARWCKSTGADGLRLSIAISGSDASGLNKKGEFSDVAEATQFLPSLARVSELALDCSRGSRSVVVYLYEPTRTSYADSLEVESDDEDESNAFAERLASRIDEISPALGGPVSLAGYREVTCEARLFDVSLTALSVRSLCLLCKDLLGYDDLPSRDTVSITGRDPGGRAVDLKPSSFSDAVAHLDSLASVRGFSLSVYGDRRLYIDISPRWLRLLTAKATSADAAWADNAALAVRSWARQSRLTGVRYVVSRARRLLWDYGFLLIGMVPVLAVVLLQIAAPQGSETTSARLRDLQQARTSLKRSIEYIDALRDDVRAEQTALEAVKREHEAWAPLAKVDQETVDSITRLLARNARRDRWLDIAVSFLVGVLSSLAAAWLYMVKRSRRLAGAVAPSSVSNGTAAAVEPSSVPTRQNEKP